MASYFISLTNNGSGVFTPVVRRNGTAASGGSAITIPWVENKMSGANTSSKLIGTALWAGFTAVVNDRANNPLTNVNYSINLSWNGTDSWSPAALKSATLASGGTVLTIPWVENEMNGANTNSALISAAFQACRDAIVNDRSNNGD
jgi:hypothetical protein